MLGIVAELLVSWIVLWLVARKGLGALGLTPSRRRVTQLLFGLVVSAICCGAYFLAQSMFKGAWSINPGATTLTLAIGVWWTLVSVVYEELLFRGVLLYWLLRKVSCTSACLLSAGAFGAYHWFSMGALGNPVQMLYVFVMTGTWGLMFAVAFAKTGSLYFPVGLHWGWNLTSIVVFSHGPLGNQLLLQSGGQKVPGLASLGLMIFQLLSVPLVAHWYLMRATELPALRRPE
jgi:membrane protease YdiL (CAAX protease family)